MAIRADERRILSPWAVKPRRSTSRLLAAVSASIEPLENRLFLSASLPAFLPPVQISTGAAPVALTTDDFNADGTEDIAVANSAGNSIDVFSGNGDGTFGKPASYAVGSDPTAIATADLNNDGSDDIVTADAGSGDISILLARVDRDGNPTGAFAKARTFHVEAGGQGPMSLVANDFNNDGNADIAVASAGGFYILFGNGNGHFQKPVQISTGALGGIVSGDFNQDGNEDLAVTNPTAGTVEVFAGNGDGTFGAPTSVTVASGVSGITTGDFNADGVTDLAVTVPGQNQLDVMLGNTITVTVSGPTPGPIPIDPLPLSPIVMPVAAASAAGAVSVVGTGSGGTVSTSDFTYATGTGTFASPIAIPISGNPASVTVYDINGDGNDDLVIANTPSNAVTVIPGNGDGTFGAAVDIPTGTSPVAVVADDFNGDAGTDLATVNASGGVSVVLQQSADIGVTLNASATRATLGSNLTYTEIVTNSGPGSASNVTLSDFLPTGVTLVSAIASQGTVDTTTNSGDADVALGDLASGGSATVTIVVNPTSYGALGNSVWINSNSVDPSYDNNYASVDTPVVGSSGAEVSVTADPGGYFVQVGQDITDSFTVTNNGPDAASGLTLTDALPAGVTYVSGTTNQGTISRTSGTELSASLGDLAVGASAMVSVTFTSSTTGQLADTATVAAANPATDPFADDNTATADTYLFDRFGHGGPIPLLPISIAGGGKGGLYTLASTTGTLSKATGPAGAVPSISISNVKKREVSKGTTQFTFTVTRSGNLNGVSSLRYQTVDGTAKAGVAYQAASGQLSFASGVARQTVSIQVNGSKSHVPTQSFVVALAGAKNATFKHSRATGTIIGAGKKIVTKARAPKSPQNPAAQGLKINFEPAGGPTIAGYFRDTGLPFGARANGLTFGWSSLNTANAITRSGVKDPRYASFNLLGSPGANVWQIALPNGRYSVQAGAGDSTITSGSDAVQANGTLVLSRKLSKNHPFATGSAIVKVTEGVLSLTDASLTAVPLDFITIRPRA